MRILYIIICSLFIQSFNNKSLAQYKSPPGFGIDFKLNKYSNLKNLQPGVGLSFLNGISPRYSYIISSSGSFLDSALEGPKESNKKLFLETNISFIRKLNKPFSRYQPYILLGTGIAYYDKKYGVFIPAGLGMQSTIVDGVFMNVSFQYRLNIASRFNNHYCFSIGLGGILGRKTKIIQPTIAKRINPTESINLVAIPLDTDHDGIIDSLDACPDLAGTLINKGCPEAITAIDPSLVLDSLAKNILFESNSANLRPVSFSTLNEVAKILFQFPTIYLRIEGHTDSIGTEEKNLKLSIDRSETVMKYLNSKGILISRLHASGFGESRPVANNDSDEGRMQNRRVELIVDKNR